MRGSNSALRNSKFIDVVTGTGGIHLELRLRHRNLVLRDPEIEAAQCGAKNVGVRPSVDSVSTRNEVVVHTLRRGEHRIEIRDVVLAIAGIKPTATEVVVVGVRSSGGFPTAEHIGVGLASFDIAPRTSNVGFSAEGQHWFTEIGPDHRS